MRYRSDISTAFGTTIFDKISTIYMLHPTAMKFLCFFDMLTCLPELKTHTGARVIVLETTMWTTTKDDSVNSCLTFDVYFPLFARDALIIMY